jgi:hypothetical protein
LYSVEPSYYDDDGEGPARAAKEAAHRAMKKKAIKKKARKFEFYSRSEFEHSFGLVADTPEKALDAAIQKCESGVPGALVEMFYQWLTERAPDGAVVRKWEVDEDGSLIERR